MSRATRPVVAAALVALTSAGLAACGGGSHPTPAASPSTSATPSATATPPPVAVKTCPLTGLPPKNGQDVERVALAAKIDNVGDARPQAGLDHADIVVEETVEGGLTRLFAIFQCDSVRTIGPIRSARTSDGDLLRLLNGAVFAFSGANSHVIAQLRATKGAALIWWDSTPQHFTVNPSRPAVHNVFASTHSLLRAGLALNPKLDAPRRVFAYGTPKHVGTKAKTVSVSWPAASAAWTWNGRVWLRTQNGSADVLTSGKRVGVPNVVIMSITVANTGLHDVLGNPSPDDVVTGSGKVWVLRDGHVIRGTWKRPTAADRMVLKDRDGALLPLHPGRTWVELLPRPRTPHLS